MINKLIFCILILLPAGSGAVAGSLLPGASNSLFGQGKWLKTTTSSTGIHKINYTWLKNNGFAHPENVRIFSSRNEKLSDSDFVSSGNRPVQIPVLRSAEGNGGGSLIFYVQGPISWRYDSQTGLYQPERNQVAGGKSFLYLTDDAGTELNVSVAGMPPVNPDVLISEFDDLSLWEEENLNLLESGSRWFTSAVTGGGRLGRSFSFPDRIAEEEIKISVFAAARSTAYTGAVLSVNGNSFGSVTFSPVGKAAGSDFAALDSIRGRSVVPGRDLTVTFQYNGGSTDQCWLDYVALQVRRRLLYGGYPLAFRDSRSPADGRIAEFRVQGVTPGLVLWDLSNPMAPMEVKGQLVGNQGFYQSKNSRVRDFILFDPGAQYPGLSPVGIVKNAEILSVQVPELLILTAGELTGQAERLAAFHRQSDGMGVSVVTVESIFDELAGGYRDITALKQYIGYLLQKGGGPGSQTLRYLLLFGKGTCDPVREPGPSNPNLVPAFQSENSLNAINSYVTDDFYGTFPVPENPGENKLAIGIGRIPAVSAEEASVAVDKIVGYRSARTVGEWRNNVAFIGDDEDNNMHMADSEALANLVNQKHPEYRTAKIYLDAYRQVNDPGEKYPEVNEAICSSLQAGDLIVNYIGHASEDGLAHEKIFTLREIETLTNKDRLPLFVTATCEFSRWDMLLKRSAGERLLFHPAGGAIALLSATRLVYAASNFALSKSFFNHVFDRDEAGNHLRLGDLVRIVKNENGGSLNARKFSLLGDPALRLNYPGYRCREVEINQLPPDQFSGTVSPGSLVTVSGEIQDADGKKLDLSGGELHVTVYDQPAGKYTLGNGGQLPFPYPVRENILFKGTSAVRNGKYQYTFIVPKDVSFDEGSGLISSYFANDKLDANGAFTPIRFNGTGIVSFLDNKGPGIRLYLGSDQFTDGSRVSQKPLLLAYLQDESGINTSGVGIGHDITLELDEKSSDLLTINDFYQADPGTWKSGRLLFPLPVLSEGSHVLKLKAWDTANNSSTAAIRFEVVNMLKINSVVNYPNPFSDRTEFIVEQNCYDEIFEVELEISDLAGRKISSGHFVLGSAGYLVRGLSWEPGLLNSQLPDGIYSYRISLTSPGGAKAYRGGKLLLKK